MNAAGASASTGRILNLTSTSWLHTVQCVPYVQEKGSRESDQTLHNGYRTRGDRSRSWPQRLYPVDPDGCLLSRGITLHWARRVLCGPTHTPLLLQLAGWGEPKVLHAMKGVSDPGRISLHGIAHLPCSSSSCILCRPAGHKIRWTPYLRHVIFLFRAC